MKLQANQLSSHLKSRLAPCYLVSGDEHLLVNEALDAIRASAKAQGFLSRDLHVATARGFDWGELFQSSSNLSLFAEKRILELRIPTGKPGRAGSEAIVDLVSQLDDELMLIVVTPRLDRNAQKAKWVKSLENAGAWLPVWPVELRELPGWIAGRMRDIGLQPDRDAARLIAGRVEGNLLAADQEVQKLRLLLGEGEVTSEQVAAAVADSSRFDVFKFADAALSGNARRAARILYGLQHEGTAVVIVLWALAKEIRTLSAMAEATRLREDMNSVFRANQVWPQRQPLLRQAMARHSASSLADLLVAVSEADATAKGRRRGDAWQLAMDISFGLASDLRRAA